MSLLGLRLFAFSSAAVDSLSHSAVALCATTGPRSSHQSSMSVRRHLNSAAPPPPSLPPSLSLPGPPSGACGGLQAAALRGRCHPEDEALLWPPDTAEGATNVEVAGCLCCCCWCCPGEGRGWRKPWLQGHRQKTQKEGKRRAHQPREGGPDAWGGDLRQL